MKVSLIGMSGSGKSFWSKKLEETGFKLFCCDDLIEEKLDPELKSRGLRGIEDVAKWMGQPFDPQYSETSKKYLDFEGEVMDEVLTLVANASENENIAIDTTGSVIYTGEAVLRRLSDLTRVVYLDTPPSVLRQMYRLYLAEPKPVIWGKAFHKNEGEDNMKALGRCYPNLLAFRTAQYKKLADVTISYKQQHSEGYDLTSFMKEIQR